jgi:hypothetical protein
VTLSIFEPGRCNATLANPERSLWLVNDVTRQP